MTATIYPASLPAKANGWRFQAWCNEHQTGKNTKTRRQARSWVEGHNAAEHPGPHPANPDGSPCSCPECLYQPRPGRTYQPRTTEEPAE